MSKWTLTVEEDPETGDMILPFNDEILEATGWKIGDTLTWTVNDDGTWIIEKKQNADTTSNN
jgi:hypothetical protein